MSASRLRRAALALALAPLLAGAAPGAATGAAPDLSPFTAEQPDVRAGNQRLAAGDAAGALSAYDAAEKAMGPRAEIDFDRGHALLAQGKHAEARQAWRRAAEADARGHGRLSSRAWQNMGSALAGAGDQEGAKQAFSEALRRDPANEDARYNLEVLQRRPKGGQGAPQPRGEPGQRPEQGPSQQGAGAPPPPPDGTEEQRGKDGQQAQQGQPAPPQGQAQQPEQQPAQQGNGKDEERREREAGARQGEPRGGQEQQAGARPPGAAGEPGAAAADDLDRREAERILDTLRSRERPMPLGPAARSDDRRRDVEKDW